MPVPPAAAAPRHHRHITPRRAASLRASARTYLLSAKYFLFEMLWGFVEGCMYVCIKTLFSLEHSAMPCTKPM